MVNKIEIFNNASKKDLPDIRTGDTVKVYQKIKEKDKERIQVFEGIVIARKHGKEVAATITVRRVISGIGVEKIFPIYSPLIEKIEVVKRSRVKRAKLYYLRTAKGKKSRLKIKEFAEAITQEETPSVSLSNENPENKEEDIKIKGE